MLEQEETPEGRPTGTKTPKSVPPIDHDPAAQDAVWAVLPDKSHGRLREIAEWGVRIVFPGPLDLAAAGYTRFELRNDTKVLAANTARVAALITHEVGVELLLWVVDPNDRWRTAVAHTNSVLNLPSVPLPPATRQHIPADRLTARLRALAVNHARARIRSLSAPTADNLSGRLDPDRGLLLEWHPRLAEMKTPYEVQIEGPFSTLALVTDTLDWSEVPPVTTATATLRRRLRRVFAPSGAKVILWGEGIERLELRMHDISFGGVSATVPSDDLRLKPTTKLSDVVVTWRGGPQLRFAGSIRHRSPTLRRGMDVIGLQLSGAPEPQRERWSREVESLLYPNTRSFGHNYQSIWDLFEASGYFDLSNNRRETAGFQKVRNAFEHAYGKLAAAPDLGCLAAFESPTRAEASLAGLRLWSRTWIGFQLARDPVRPHLTKSDSGALRDLFFHVYERAGANPDLKWLVAFIRDDAPSFSKVLHREFVLTSPEGCAVPFQAWKLNITMKGTLSTPRVSTATLRQTRKVLHKLAEIRPAFYLEAHDLLPETFHQEELQDEWRFFGLLRERTLLVATDEGKLMAAAVLDAAEDGLHLYGLFDSARLFELEPGGIRYFGELLVAANEWFYGQGKNSFVCFGEDLSPEIMQSEGAISLGDGMVTYLPTRAIPDILERVSELTAPKNEGPVQRAPLWDPKHGPGT